MKIGRRRVKVKRDCITGRFVPASRRALGCVIKPRTAPADWTAARDESSADKVCYASKGQALRVFVAWNEHTVESWGLDTKATGGEFDAVNERHGLKGAKRVTTLRGALVRALDGKPYCLDRIDLEMLNETQPGREHPFRLPDHVVEQTMLQRYREEWERAAAAGDDVPF